MKITLIVIFIICLFAYIIWQKQKIAELDAALQIEVQKKRNGAANIVAATLADQIGRGGADIIVV